MFKRLKDINWENWKPEQRATLLFVIKNGRILLIHKKRGLGAGKINGPGGRLDAGESPRQAAIRETQEELGINPIGVTFSGELSFQFCDGLALHVTVFRASDFTGMPRETEEAKPLWVPLNEIPFDRMWADDYFWFPYLLIQKQFRGRFLFDQDTMIDFELAETRDRDSREAKSNQMLSKPR
ncbi:8-oxo-dGTP diphosphatase [candidate division CSSED10-310 bacterium]|uniref:Oxidized purine nucleoside triphosphate hydrolase n=1 Tax=candidate division CSSED10-310 bacterium TaxID=2855610 RepID=A0ABV6YQZ3_UNCC1